MSFWESFKEGYRSSSGGSEASHDRWRRPPPPHNECEMRAERARLESVVREQESELTACRSEIEGLQARNDELAAELAQTRRRPKEDPHLREECNRLAGELAESKSLIADLAAEAEKLSAELKASRRAERQGKGDEKYKKLRRFVIKLVHPDLAGSDKRLKGLLERICREVNAEIDRIDQS